MGRPPRIRRANSLPCIGTNAPVFDADDDVSRCAAESGETPSPTSTIGSSPGSQSTTQWSPRQQRRGRSLSRSFTSSTIDGRSWSPPFFDRPLTESPPPQRPARSSRSSDLKSKTDVAIKREQNVDRLIAEANGRSWSPPTSDRPLTESPPPRPARSSSGTYSSTSASGVVTKRGRNFDRLIAEAMQVAGVVPPRPRAAGFYKSLPEGEGEEEAHGEEAHEEKDAVVVVGDVAGGDGIVENKDQSDDKSIGGCDIGDTSHTALTGDMTADIGETNHTACTGEISIEDFHNSLGEMTMTMGTVEDFLHLGAHLGTFTEEGAEERVL
mmetsp:Transcript_33661/g.71761  ORF Transcript_33661/g.71761 Transcript_33661/m.71761 type:complete len:325 (+) Transcript_33661:219-1193(+)